SRQAVNGYGLSKAFPAMLCYFRRLLPTVTSEWSYTGIMRVQTRVLVVVLLVLALSGASALSAHSSGALTIGLATEPVSLDPAKGLFSAEQWVLMNIYDTLTRVDQAGELHPGLATGWEVNDDATEFTFTLRSDVTFHDGTPFNAQAVKAYFDRIAEAGDPVAIATSVLSGYVEAEAVDDTTLVVRFADPKPIFLNDLSRPWMGIPSPAASG